MSDQDELIAAVRRGSLPVVRQLLANDRGLAAIADEKGNTPLHYAAAAGNAAMVRLLLEHDADIDAIVKKGGTPINYAAEHGQVEVVQSLLDAGADLHIGSGPGHWAYYSENRQGEVLAYLRHSEPVADLIANAGALCEASEEYLLTKMVSKTVPAMSFLYVGTEEPITHAGISQADEEAGELMNREHELLRRGPLTWVYHSFSSGVSSYLEPAGTMFFLNMGFEVGEDTQLGEGRLQIGELGRYECASLMLRGSLYRMAYAHHQLREQMRDKGLQDAGRQLREIYHYFEGADSDYNITEIQIEIEP